MIGLVRSRFRPFIKLRPKARVPRVSVGCSAVILLFPKMSALSTLPHRIPVLNSIFQIKSAQAIELLKNRRAREVYQDGEFLGIEIGHFGPKPAMLDKSPLPPVELPGLKFRDPNPANNFHRFVMAYMNG